MEVWSQHFRDIPWAQCRFQRKTTPTKGIIEITLLERAPSRRKQVVATGIPERAT
jgi:hypothetical protein